MPLPDDPQLIRNLEMIEAQAIVDLLNAMPHDLQLQLGVAVMPLGSGVAIVMKQVPVLLLNRVIGLGIVEPGTEQMVDEICSMYERAGVRTGIQLAPTAKPEQVKEWLEKRGLELTGTWGKLYRGSEPAGGAETDLKIEQIGRERAEEFGDIAAKAYQLPDTLSNWIALSVGRDGWRHYMALDGKKGVGVAALYVQGEVGWL